MKLTSKMPSSPCLPAAARRTAGDRPSPNTPSTASTPPAKGEKCYPCVRYDLSPMPQAAHLRALRTPNAVRKGQLAPLSLQDVLHVTGLPPRQDLHTFMQ